MDYTQVPWRVGTHIRRSICAVVPGVDEAKLLLGMMDTDELAAEVVKAHNSSFDVMTFGEKEQLIKDLESVRDAMIEDGRLELEQAILIATESDTRAKRVYDSYGASAEMLQDMDISKVVPHAVNLIRSQ